MKPFLVNRHGRLVFPANFLGELDFSVLESLDQFTAVIGRDFEAKAPTANADQVEMLGQIWRVAVARSGTDDPEIQRVRIDVFPAQDSVPLASLDGFVDGRTG